MRPKDSQSKPLSRGRVDKRILGLSVLRFLAGQSRRTLIGKIADYFDISRDDMEQVVSTLRLEDKISVTRGVWVEITAEGMDVLYRGSLPSSSRTVRLWDHQCRASDYLLEEIQGSTPYGVVGMPTGAGKTAIAVVTAKRAILDGVCSHVLLLTPFTHSADGFMVNEIYDCDGLILDISRDFWLETAPSGKRGEQFQQWLSSDNKQALVTTHAQAVRGWVDLLPDDCGGLLVVCDEIHHGGEDATRLREFLDVIYERGGMVAGLSATLFRTDGKSLFPANVDPLVFSYTSLASQGLFPAKISFRLVSLGPSSGELSKDHLKKACSYIVAEDRVCIINIQPGESESTALRVIDALVDAGADRNMILNAVGTSSSVSSRVRDALSNEREIVRDPLRGYGSRKIHYVVSCQRFREAADLASCSHVVSFGVTTSLQMAVQNIGRALRNKQCIAGYPEEWENESLYTLFVPDIDRDRSARSRVVQMLMQLSCLLEGSESVMHFHRSWPLIVKGMRLPPLTRSSFTRKIQCLLLGSTPEEEADARKLLAVEAQRLREALGRAPTVHEVVRALQGTPESKEDQVRATVAALLLSADEHSGVLSEVEDVVARAMRGYLESSDSLEDVLLNALGSLAEKYIDMVTDYDGRLLSGLQGVLSTHEIREMTRQMVRSRDLWLSRERWSDLKILEEIVVPYINQWGHNPRVSRGEQDISVFVGSRCSLSDLDNLLRASGFSLDLLLVSRSHATSEAVSSVEIQRIAPLVRRRRRSLDSRNWRDGPTLRRALASSRWTSGGVNLVGLDLAIRRGWRGFPGGQTLVEVVENA